MDAGARTLNSAWAPALGNRLMAITKLAETITGIRGTIAGVTYSANRSGTYIKKWAKGVNPQSMLQQIVRGLPAAVGPYWNALTDEQRTDWDQFALVPNELDFNSLGVQYFLSGYNWFVRANVRRALVDLAPTDTPPSGPAATAVTGLSLDAEYSLAGELIVDWTDDQFEETDSLIIEAAPAQGKNRTAPPNIWRKVYAHQNPGNDPIDIATAYNGFFGDPIDDYRIFLRAFKQAEAGNRSVVAVTSDYVH